MINETTKQKKNMHKKIARTFSFAYEEGYRALEYLDKVGKTVAGGKSGYIVNLILQDMEKNQQS